MTTTHTYINDLLLRDEPHKDSRRVGAVSMSITPTTTGAAKSKGEIPPDIEDEMKGMTWRVQVRDGSMTVFVLTSRKGVINDKVDRALKVGYDHCEKDINGVRAFTGQPLVSVDVAGEPQSYIADGQSTRILENEIKAVKVLPCYDKERRFALRFVGPMKFVRSGAKWE